MSAGPNIHGLMAEFVDHEQVVHAAKRAHALGYRRMDAYTPFPIEDLPEALGCTRTGVPLIVLLGGLVGAGGGLLHGVVFNGCRLSAEYRRATA